MSAAAAATSYSTKTRRGNTGSGWSAGLLAVPGKSRLPGGEPRKASQRNTRRAAVAPAQIAPSWQPGAAVRWKDRGGIYRRDVGDGEHSEITIGQRVYRVRTGELR